MTRLLIVAIAAISAAAAQAAPVPGTATIAAPTEIARIVTESGSWRCAGTSCDGPADTVAGIAVAACTAVADRAGRVTAFTAGDMVFAEAALARCNRHVK